MKTKKILSLVLAAIMMMGLATTSFAAETNTHELVYQNNASYEINIPSTSSIDIATGKGQIEVSVTDAKLESGSEVTVTVASPNYNGGSWNLVNVKNSSDVIGYFIGTEENGEDISSGDTVIKTSVPTSTVLYIKVEDTSFVGTYKDTITFTSEIKEKIINFSIDGYSLQAIEGMTWKDWCDSDYNPGEEYYYGTSQDVIYEGTGKILNPDGMTDVKPSDIIQSEADYVWFEIE